MRKAVIVISVLVVVLLGIFVLNKSGMLFPSVKYNLTEKYGISNADIVGYGVYNQDDVGSIARLISESQDLFQRYQNEGGKLYFVFGNENGITLVSYEQIVGGSIGIELGDKYGMFKIRKEELKTGQIIPDSSNIEIEIDNIKYKFRLKGNENSYFIVYKNTTREL